MDIQGDGTKNMNGSIGDLEDKNDKNDDECGNLDIWEIDDDDYLDNDNMNIDEPELDRHSTKSKTR
ncbi:18934_t:CDS:2 [Entrophospora sp. SA101]|nr:18934_t:CDS:2 [Entrophospora sp. SA101]